MKLTGVIPALITPFDKNNNIDFNTFEKHLTNLRAAGVSGWVPNGSTGEYFSQNNKERIEVLKFVKEFANDDEILIAGTNASATREVIENTAMAKEIGYDCVLLATPFYTRPTDTELINHYNSVLNEVDVELILYNYPHKDGIEISFDVMDALADNPQVIAIKESSGVLQRAIDIYNRYKGRIDLVSGSDDLALDFMVWGADSWICGPANCMAKACCDLDRTFRLGNFKKARDQMAILYKAMNILESGKFVQKIKYGCDIQGTPVGVCRAPLGALSDKEKEEFNIALQPILNWKTFSIN